MTIRLGILTGLTIIANAISPNSASAQVNPPKTFTNSTAKNNKIVTASPSSFLTNFFDNKSYNNGLFLNSATSITPNGQCDVTNSHVLHNESPFYTLQISDSKGSVQNQQLVLTIPDYQDSNDIAAIGTIYSNETPEQAKQRCVEFLLKNSLTQAELNDLYTKNQGTFTLQTLFPVKNRSNVENLNSTKTELNGLIYLGEYQGVRYFALPTKLNAIEYIGKGPSGSGVFNKDGKLVGLYTTFHFLFFGQKLLSDSIHNIHKNIRTLDLETATIIAQKEKKSDRTLNYITLELLKEFSLKELIKKRYQRLEELDEYLKENPDDEKLVKLVNDIIAIENQAYDVKIEIGKLLEKFVTSNNLNSNEIDAFVQQVLSHLEKLIEIDIPYRKLFGNTSTDGTLYELVKNLPGEPNPRNFFSSHQLIGVASITKENIAQLTIHPLSRHKSPLLNVLSKNRLSINKEQISQNAITGTVQNGKVTQKLPVISPNSDTKK